MNQADNQPYPFRDDTGQYGERVQSYVDEHPNDQVTRITEGTELGWPFCQPDSRGKPDLLDLGYVDDPTNNPHGKSLDCSTVSRTMVGLPAHSAPIGFVFTGGSALPEEFRDGALITTHGSWNREPRGLRPSRTARGTTRRTPSGSRTRSSRGSRTPAVHAGGGPLTPCPARTARCT